MSLQFRWFCARDFSKIMNSNIQCEGLNWVHSSRFLTWVTAEADLDHSNSLANDRNSLCKLLQLRAIKLSSYSMTTSTLQT